MAPDELQHLLRVLDERNIPLGHDDVAWAFERNESSPVITAWVQEFLSPSTMLTKEELHFHNARNNGTHRITEERYAGRPLADAAFEAAIASLEASTAAVEKQCQLLKTQKHALAELKARNAGTNADHSAQDRQKKLVRETAQLDFEVDELADGLQSKLLASRKQADAAVSGLPSSVDRVLEKDDRLLDGVQKVLPKLADAGADEDLRAEVDRLCQALTALSAQEIRLRVDAAYRTSVQGWSAQADGHTPKIDTQRQSLQAELEELSHEIDGLATMAVDGQYRLPILRELQGNNSETAIDRARWADYMIATLQYLTTRLVAFEQHALHLHAHQAALKQTSSALETTLTKPDTQQIQQGTRQTSVKSPATPTAKGLKPLRLVQAQAQAQLSIEPQDPIPHLLRSLDLRVPDATDTPIPTKTLAQASKDRHTHLQQLSESTERTISDQLAESLGKADRDVRDLVGAVFAYAEFGGVGIGDAEVEGGLAGLEDEVGRLGEEMGGVDFDAIVRMVREKQREMVEQRNG